MMPRPKDYARENKQTRPNSYMKKQKLPTKSKTSKHKCSQCQRKDACLYPVGEKEKRWLCADCVRKNQNKNANEKPNFIKANVLKHD